MPESEALLCHRNVIGVRPILAMSLFISSSMQSRPHFANPKRKIANANLCLSQIPRPRGHRRLSGWCCVRCMVPSAIVWER